MSALPLDDSSANRRRAERTRISRILHATVGRTDGVFVDLSLRGAKIRHSGALRRGAAVRITFEWERQRFAATAEVLASRIVALGAREDQAATFESRFQFVAMSTESSEILARVLADVANDELRGWVGNLKGYGAAEPETTRGAGFIRCRRIGMRWEKKWTRDAAQPTDGFVLPAGVDPAQVDELCRTWEATDAGGRQLVQLTAAAVVQAL